MNVAGMAFTFVIYELLLSVIHYKLLLNDLIFLLMNY